MTVKETISRLIERQNLSPEEAGQIMGAIMEGSTTQSQIGAFLTALHMKGETPEEIAAFARVMRQHAITVAPATGKRWSIPAEPVVTAPTPSTSVPLQHWWRPVQGSRW
jgi:anthranilate phosphoribosyltransferase